MVANPLRYFEIPVADMNRAIEFYQSLLGLDLERQTIDGYEMALFPFIEGATGATGALAAGDVYIPGKTGPIIYFGVDDIDAILAKAALLGADVLYPKKFQGEFGFVAEIEDSEGNRIALHQSGA